MININMDQKMESSWPVDRHMDLPLKQPGERIRQLLGDTLR